MGKFMAWFFCGRLGALIMHYFKYGCNSGVTMGTKIWTVIMLFIITIFATSLEFSERKR